MSTSIHASLLLILLVVCFTSSALADSPDLSRPPTLANLSSIHFQPNSNDTNQDQVMLTFTNNIPRGEEEVFLFFNLEDKKTILVPGVPVSRYANLEQQTGLIYWSFLCVIFYQYDPGVDAGHANVYWSATVDGLYHSWDNHKWDLKAQWRSDNCDGHGLPRFHN